MMTAAAIRESAERAGRHARRNRYVPFLVTEENKREALEALARGERPRTMNIPYIGDYVPSGYRPSGRDDLFVDTTGFGDPREPALTVEEFVAALVPGRAYAIVEAGQFQAYVREYIPVKRTKKTKRTDRTEKTDKTESTEYNVYTAMLRYESGYASPREVLELFSHLVKTKLAWILQGSYGRSARALIDHGFLDEDGSITPKGQDAIA